MWIRKIVARKVLGLFGWQVEGTVPDVPRMVIIGYPHTSQADLWVGLLTAAALDIKFHWLGKQELFEGFQGWVLRKMRGIPIDRSGHHNIVDQVADHIRAADRLILVLAPEGTRGRAECWRSGFYWIARAADVPIVVGKLDFGRKISGLSHAIDPHREIHEVMDEIRGLIDGIEGRYPEKVGPPRLRDEPVPA